MKKYLIAITIFLTILGVSKCFSTPFASGATTVFVAGTTTIFTNAPAGGGDITTGLVIHEVLATSAPDFTLVNGPTFSSSALNFIAASSQFAYTTATQQWPQTSLTMSIWMNTTTPTATYSLPSMYNQFSGGGGSYCQIFISGGSVHARMQQNQDVDYIGQMTGNILTTGNHMITMVWTGGTSSANIFIYVDGLIQTTSNDSGGTFTAPYAGSNLPISIGGQLNAGGLATFYYDGKNWGFYIFGRALTANDIGGPTTSLLSTGN